MLAKHTQGCDSRCSRSCSWPCCSSRRTNRDSSSGYSYHRRAGMVWKHYSSSYQGAKTKIIDCCTGSPNLRKGKCLGVINTAPVNFCAWKRYIERGRAEALPRRQQNTAIAGGKNQTIVWMALRGLRPPNNPHQGSSMRRQPMLAFLFEAVW